MELDGILADLRRANIVHRDIRPHNLIFDKGKLKVLDFQLAMVNGEELKAKTPQEKYVLSVIKKNLGGQWYANSLPVEEKDANAVEMIKAEYTSSVGISQRLTLLSRHYKNRLKRYAFYK